MTKKYNISKSSIYGHAPFALIPLYAAYVFIGSENIPVKIIGLILAAIVFVPFYNLINKPMIIVDDLKIVKNNLVGKNTVVTNLQEYIFVVSGDFLAFRKAGENDIMVSKK